MTAQAAQNKLNAKIARLSVAMLKEMAANLQNDHRDGTDVLLSAVLDALMGRLPDDEFIAFCEAL